MPLAPSRRKSGWGALGTLLILFALPIITACSFDYEVRAALIGGRIQFETARANWFAGDQGFCPAYFSVRNGAGQTVWRIEHDGFDANCRLFPLPYGLAPRGWRTVVDATPLLPDELYVMHGAGGDSYHGAFRYRAEPSFRIENEPQTARQFAWPGEEFDNSAEGPTTNSQ